MADGEDFNWTNVDDDELIVPTVMGIAVYRNPKGEIVIRQQGGMLEPDTFVVVPLSHAERLAQQVLNLVAQSREE